MGAVATAYGIWKQRAIGIRKVDRVRHDPVMVAEVLSDLALKPGDTVVDGTLGLGGHSSYIARQIAPNGTILGIDWDDAMLAEARLRLSGIEQVQLILERDDYKAIPALVGRHGLSPSAIFLDMGLNLAQIEDPTRGIAFSSDSNLDMRMDRSRGETAASMLNRMSPQEIERILFELGDERWARAIARKIVERRKDNPLRTTSDLVDCVLAAIPQGARDKRIHPATRSFQAVRIAVNREFEGLEDALIGSAETLKPGGTMAILTYHSGEDRIVKNAFRTLAQAGGFESLRRKPLGPTAEEVSRNPRSRSAKLRSIRRDAG